MKLHAAVVLSAVVLSAVVLSACAALVGCEQPVIARIALRVREPVDAPVFSGASSVRASSLRAGEALDGVTTAADGAHTVFPALALGDAPVEVSALLETFDADGTRTGIGVSAPFTLPARTDVEAPIDIDVPLVVAPPAAVTLLAVDPLPALDAPAICSDGAGAVVVAGGRADGVATSRVFTFDSATLAFGVAPGALPNELRAADLDCAFDGAGQVDAVGGCTEDNVATQAVMIDLLGSSAVFNAPSATCGARIAVAARADGAKVRWLHTGVAVKRENSDGGSARSVTLDIPEGPRALVAGAAFALALLTDRTAIYSEDPDAPAALVRTQSPVVVLAAHATVDGILALVQATPGAAPSRAVLDVDGATGELRLSDVHEVAALRDDTVVDLVRDDDGALVVLTASDVAVVSSTADVTARWPLATAGRTHIVNGPGGALLLVGGPAGLDVVVRDPLAAP